MESHTGLLLEAGHDLFEFSHKSLQEYLTAEFIVRLPSIPDDFSLLLLLPNELAIATAISSRPSEYLAQLTLGALTGRDARFGFIRAFVSRLLLERPDFERTPRVAAAVLALNSQYISAILHGPENVDRSVVDHVAGDFLELARIIRPGLPIIDLLEVFERESVGPATAAGPVVRLKKKHCDYPSDNWVRAELAKDLPAEIWVSEMMLNSKDVAR